MKTISRFWCIGALALLAACDKPRGEEQRKAEIEREVQQRLAAEHQADSERKLADEQAALELRDKAVAERERALAERIAATPQPAPLAESNEVETRESPIRQTSRLHGTFYTELESFGDWLESAEYGYVWQPIVARESRVWRPYTEGRWVYTDAGWTWVSAEPFGWATHHYGRWMRLRKIGWVWVPGDEWAPAWVSWRTGGDYVGWAPLPPEAQFDHRVGIQRWADNSYDISPEQYIFVPVRELGAQRVEAVAVPPDRNVTIVTQTVNVTNITYSNTTIINQGPDYEELRVRTREPIQRLKLEKKAGAMVQNAPAVVRGDVLEVTAPAARQEAPQRPRVVKGAIKDPASDYTAGVQVDEDARQKARAKMKAETAASANTPKRNIAPVGTPVRPITPEPAAPVKTTPKPAPVTNESTPPAPRRMATPPSEPAILPAPTGTPKLPPPAPELTSPAPQLPDRKDDQHPGKNQRATPAAQNPGATPAATPEERDKPTRKEKKAGKQTSAQTSPSQTGEDTNDPNDRSRKDRKSKNSGRQTTPAPGVNSTPVPNATPDKAPVVE